MGRPAADPLQVGAWLGHARAYDQWIEQLADVEVVHPFEPRVPDDEELVLLGLSPEDIVEVRASRPAVGEDVELWWLWERCVAWLTGHIGRDVPMTNWPTLPSAHGRAAQFFFVHVYLAVVDQTRHWHRERGVPEEVSRATLADLGAKTASYRRTWGVSGMDRHNWLSQHLMGRIFRLGRLQFDRSVVPALLESPVPVADAWPTPGTPCWGIHIPEDGPLTPASCDASIELAVEFFSEVFPDDGTRVATCQSWLLDQQLLDYLAPTSNIVAFQRRFALWPGHLAGDSDIAEFVFRRDPNSLHDAPQDTALQRAITTHLRSGRHWQLRRGWLSVGRTAQP